jgi:threonine dehydrogenase-like Zn-dependent dehydrogenase
VTTVATSGQTARRERSTAAFMKALVYHGPGQRAWENRPRPVIQDATDAIVHITTSTICGTDLHILKGDVPTVTDGRILGHEGVGIVEETGDPVSTVHRGDHVLVSCITSWLDSRKHDRRDPGGIRADSACRSRNRRPDRGCLQNDFIDISSSHI